MIIENCANLIDLNKPSSYPSFYSFFSKDFLDSEESFKENLKTQPKNWYYRNNAVLYSVNSQGYRCNDFKYLDWGNSIIMLGCSYVFGASVTDHDTLPFRLQELLGIDVINLGVNGGSQYTNLYNLVTLKMNGITPKAIINVWPSSNRISNFRHDMTIFHSGPWNNWGFSDRFDYTENLSKFQTHKVNLDFSMKIVELLYPDTPVLHTSMIKTDIDDRMLYLPKIDFGRDLAHPGIESHKTNAIAIYNLIKERL